MEALKHTIGNSFNASLTFRDQNDAVVDLTTVTMTSNNYEKLKDMKKDGN